MRFARRSIAVVALLLASSVARAQSPSHSDAAARAEARTHFLRGVACIAEARWADAVDELQQAQALRPTPAVMYNLGLARRAVGRNLEAIEAFRMFLVMSGDACDAACVAQVAAYTRALRADLGRIDGAIEPQGARVYIDGTAAPARPPWTVNPGRHLLVAEADGYAAVTRPVDVPRGGSVEVAVRLHPRVASTRLALGGAPEAPAVRGRTVFESPWFWVGVGVVAAGATTTFLLLRGVEAPYQGSLGTVTDALTLGAPR